MNPKPSSRRSSRPETGTGSPVSGWSPEDAARSAAEVALVRPVAAATAPPAAAAAALVTAVARLPLALGAGQLSRRGAVTGAVGRHARPAVRRPGALLAF